MPFATDTLFIRLHTKRKKRSSLPMVAAALALILTGLLTAWWLKASQENKSLAAAWPAPAQCAVSHPAAPVLRIELRDPDSQLPIIQIMEGPPPGLVPAD